MHTSRYRAAPAATLAFLLTLLLAAPACLARPQDDTAQDPHPDARPGHASTLALQGTDADDSAAPATPAAPAEHGPPEDAPRAQRPRGTPFSYEYVPPKNPALGPAYDFTRALRLFDRLPEISALDGTLALPRPLHLTTAECRQVNAFYSPGTAEIVMCYEMVEHLVTIASRLAKGAHLADDFQARFVLANLRFMMLHELGHALIDMLDIPSTGREEDAADQLAGSIMLLNKTREETAEQVADNLNMAAVFFQIGSGSGSAAPDRSAFADEHSLGEQRYYNLLCLVYGSDPARYLRLVTDGGLTVERAERCPEESRRITHAWAKLLVPHLAPRYQLSDDEATRYSERAAREQGRAAQRSPYVR